MKLICRAHLCFVCLGVDLREGIPVHATQGGYTQMQARIDRVFLSIWRGQANHDTGDSKYATHCTTQTTIAYDPLNYS